MQSLPLFRCLKQIFKRLLNLKLRLQLPCLTQDLQVVEVPQLNSQDRELLQLQEDKEHSQFLHPKDLLLLEVRQDPPHPQHQLDLEMLQDPVVEVEIIVLKLDINIKILLNILH